MAGLALTILLALLWLAFVGLGYWHGGWRQVVLLAGMLLAYAVASEWTVPNGHDLATQFHWSLPRATTAVGLLYLLGGTLVLGFLGSFALERPYPFTVLERRCGAAIGVVNGGLLLALVLRTLRSYAYVAGGGDVLHMSALSRFLIESIGYVALVAFVLGLITVVVGLTLAQRRHAPEEPIFEPAPAPAIAASPPPPQQTAAQSVNVAPPVPLQVPSRPSTPVPVYAAEPIIDWPSAPPPGRPIAPNGAPPVVTRPMTEKPPETTEAEQPVSIPTMPVLPRRIEPPMRYPVAELIAAAVPVRVEVKGQTTASPVASDTAAPPVPVPVAAPTPPLAVVSPVVRAATPPQGTVPPVSALPTVARPPISSPPAPPTPTPVQAPPAEPVPTIESAPPVIRQLDVATDDALPVVSVPDVAPATDTPPVVREIDVTTQDVPLVAAQSNVQPEPSLTDPTSRSEKAAITGPEPAPNPSAPTPPNAVTETTPIPTIIPPPLPPLPARRTPSSSEAPVRPAPPDEQARARAGFARVAVARQAGQRPDPPPPAPHSPAAPEPLQPPLPNGPRVHACPTCGYPVHNHARFCPNCGARQRP